jgi:hypothetical protein
MKIRNVFTISAVIVGLTASTAVYAAPTSIHSPVSAMFAKSKTVKLNLRNDSSATMELKVGDNVVTLEAGKTLALNLPVGTRILANATTPTHAAGSLLAEVSSQLSDATIALK